MSIFTYQSRVSTLTNAVADLKQKENAEKKKQLTVAKAVNDLEQRRLKATSTLSEQSYFRQQQSKQNELIRIEKKLADYYKQIAAKEKDLVSARTSLQNELERERKKREDLLKKQAAQAKKQRDEELRFNRDQERSRQTQLRQTQAINRELELQQNLFSDTVESVTHEADTDYTSDEDFELDELQAINQRIDQVLEQLNKMGLGQEIIWKEIEELKRKGKKLSKKDFTMLTIGKLFSFGMRAVGPDTTKDIFEAILGKGLTKFLT